MVSGVRYSSLVVPFRVPIEFACIQDRRLSETQRLMEVLSFRTQFPVNLIVQFGHLQTYSSDLYAVTIYGKTSVKRPGAYIRPVLIRGSNTYPRHVFKTGTY